MGMSGAYGSANEEESLKTIDVAIERGMNLFNTGDFYGSGHNEMLIGKGIKKRRDRVFLSVKTGALRSPGAAFGGLDCSPRALKNSIFYSLNRLGVDYIDLYQPCRVDPTVPIEESVGAIAELVKAGLVRYIGLSEVSGKTLRKAHAVHPVVACEVEYSLMDRHIENDLLPVARELGVGVVAYGVLSRGLIQSSGAVKIKDNDYRAHLPRFTGENLRKNQELVDNLQKFAAEKDATACQVAFAWVKKQGEDVFPLIGAKTVERLDEALGSLNVNLTAADLAKLNEWFPAGVAKGDRYPSQHMAAVNA
jgi:aryl-alcohol dehydrogenase-like predicted oxidoreductase